MKPAVEENRRSSCRLASWPDRIGVGRNGHLGSPSLVSTVGAPVSNEMNARGGLDLPTLHTAALELSAIKIRELPTGLQIAGRSVQQNHLLEEVEKMRGPVFEIAQNLLSCHTPVSVKRRRQ